MTGLEILDRLLLGHTAFHRYHDAWDLLDRNGDVVAVLCPRRAHLSIAPVKAKVTPAPEGRLIPYHEVERKITEDTIDEGIAYLRELVAGHPPTA